MSRISSGVIVLLYIHSLFGEGIPEHLVLHVGRTGRDDQWPFRLQKVRQEAVAILLAQLRMNHAEFDRQFDARPIDEIPDIHLLEARTLAGADTHH